jgi:hypothetical protein
LRREVGTALEDQPAQPTLTEELRSTGVVLVLDD